jgi:hypothetical protein
VDREGSPAYIALRLTELNTMLYNLLSLVYQLVLSNCEYPVVQIFRKDKMVDPSRTESRGKNPTIDIDELVNPDCSSLIPGNM